MIAKMPRGAFPTPRSELTASEPYRPDAGEEAYYPSGEFPSPNHELAAASPYKAVATAPDSVLAWPVQIGPWGKANNSTWVEEAFAKACAQPSVSIPAEAVLRAAQACGSSNFARFMQTRGFELGRAAYLDGRFLKVNWTDMAVLHAAIAHTGPVKIGIASAALASAPNGRVTEGSSGWTVFGLQAGQAEDSCASLCGYGALPALIGLFGQRGVLVEAPPGMPEGLCYAMFARGSIGIVDHQSLMNITGEAWVRDPTTIVKTLST
jgi:hypothetical protein